MKLLSSTAHIASTGSAFSVKAVAARRARRMRSSCLVVASLLGLSLLTSSRGWCGAGHVYIDCELTAPINPGQNLGVNISAAGCASQSVSVYSNIPGAVSYSGTMSADTTTVEADTDPNLSQDDIDNLVVYVQVGSNDPVVINASN